MKLGKFRGITVVLAGLWVLQAPAGEWYVTPWGAGANDGTNWVSAFSNLQQAVDMATNAGDIICLSYGVYSNPSPVVVSNKPGIRMCGGFQGMGFPGELTNEESILTRTGGYMRIMQLDQSTATLERVVISGGYLLNTLGAGLVVSNGSRLELTNAVVRNNQVYVSTPGLISQYGGGIFSHQSVLDIADSVISNNLINAQYDHVKTLYGGAIYMSGGALTLRGGTNANNRGFGINYGWNGHAHGGFLYGVGCAVDISNSMFLGNYTWPPGGDGYGGVFYFNLATARVSGCSFLRNFASTRTGAANGGVLYINGGSAVFSDCSIDNRTMEPWTLDMGYGGMYAYIVTYANMICATGGASFAMRNSTLQGSTDRGVLFLATGKLALTNSLVIGCGGDGIMFTAGTASVVNCTLADNSGWGLNRTGGTGTVANCIAWGNASGGIVSNTSVIVNNTCSQNQLAGAGNQAVDPLFAYSYYLSVSGLVGQTANSPCIDAGGGSAASLDLASRTTRTDSGLDVSDPVDMGYHYVAGVGNQVLSNTTLYVDAVNGTNTNSGLSPAVPLQTLTCALTRIVPRGGKICIATGIYSAAESFPLTSSCAGLELAGSNRDTTVISAASAGRVFQFFNAGTSLWFEGMTIADGYGSDGFGGGLFLVTPEATITNCVIRNSVSKTGRCGNDGVRGGGVYFSGNRLRVLSSTLAGNRAYKDFDSNPNYIYGGGIFFKGNILALASTAFLTNYAYHSACNNGYFYGGALYGSGSVLNMVNCTNVGNYVSYSGGNSGFRMYGGGLNVIFGDAVISNSLFYGNRILREYSAAVVDTDANAEGLGGSVYIGGGTAQVAACVFDGNYSSFSLRCNRRSRGGAIYSVAPSLSVVNSSFKRNYTRTATNMTENEGGVLYAASGNIGIMGCTVVSNGSSYTGDIWIEAGKLAMTNVLVATNNGCGLVIQLSTVTVVNCTLANNSLWGVSNAADGASLAVKNTIIWSNAAGGIYSNAKTTMIYSDSQDAWITGVGTGNINADPLFSDVSSGDYHEKSRRGSWHGGLWTGDDMTSPCIDAGEPYPASDFALEPEPNGKRINMGAYGNTAQASISPIAMGAVFSFR